MVNHAHRFVQSCTHVQHNTHKCAQMHTCPNTQAHLRVRACSTKRCKCTNFHTRSHIQKQKHMHTDTRAHTCTLTHMYTNTSRGVGAQSADTPTQRCVDRVPTCTNSHTRARILTLLHTHARAARAFTVAHKHSHPHFFVRLCKSSSVFCLHTWVGGRSPRSGRGLRAGEKLPCVRQLLGRGWDGRGPPPPPRKLTALGRPCSLAPSQDAAS